MRGMCRQQQRAIRRQPTHLNNVDIKTIVKTIVKTMSRNHREQINYLMKRRNSGMSDKDYESELKKLYELGQYDGKHEYWPTMELD